MSIYSPLQLSSDTSSNGRSHWVIEPKGFQVFVKSGPMTAAQGGHSNSNKYRAVHMQFHHGAIDNCSYNHPWILQKMKCAVNISTCFDLAIGEASAHAAAFGRLFSCLALRQVILLLPCSLKPQLQLARLHGFKEQAALWEQMFNSFCPTFRILSND